MFDPETLPRLREVIEQQTLLDQGLLDDLRNDAKTLKQNVRIIKPRTTTAVSLVASDGGNNKLVFDPFYVQLVRVVDSYGQEMCLDAVSPSTDTDAINARQFDANGSPISALGRLMSDLGARTLQELTSMIPTGAEVRAHPEDVKPGWVLVYRDICEWAVLYDRVCHTTFATDTLIVRDGLLRSKIFRGELLIRMGEKMLDSIERIQKKEHRRVLLVGLAKHTQILSRYRLAMAIEDTFPPREPRYVQVPRELEAKTYRWPEYARGMETETDGGEPAKYVLGSMFFVRFGDRSGDPVWTVDIFTPQADHCSEGFSYLLADAIEGFPVPCYPRCLQKAHEFAQVVDFDLDILQDTVINAVRRILPQHKRGVLEEIRLSPDVAARRYD